MFFGTEVGAERRYLRKVLLWLISVVLCSKLSGMCVYCQNALATDDNDVAAAFVDELLSKRRLQRNSEVLLHTYIRTAALYEVSQL